MADLIDRISGEVDRTRKLNVHRYSCLLRLYALNLWTRSQLATEFDITGHADEVRQADQIATAIDGSGNATNKIIYVLRVEAISYALEDSNDRLYHNADGTVNKTKVFQDMLIAG